MPNVRYLLKQSLIGKDLLISSSIDQYGAVEAVYRRINESDVPHSWDLERTFSKGNYENITGDNSNDVKLKFISSKESRVYKEEKYILSEAVYRGRAFTKNFLSIQASVKNEPIASHPDFNQWAGTSSSPSDDAIWENVNGVATFKAFKDDFELAGISSYLMPEWTITLTWMQEDVDLTSQPGKKYVLPEMPNYTPMTNTQYLLSSVSQEQNGASWKVTANLLAAKEWNSLIYKT